MLRAALGLLLVGLFGASGASADDAAPAGEPLPRVVDVRMAQHPAFDRVVFELDAQTPLFRLASEVEGETQLEVRAAPPGQGFRTPAGLTRLRGLLLEELPNSILIRARGRGPARVFRLQDPPRIVIDFADPDTADFHVPPGTEEVLAPRETPPEPEVAAPPPGEPAAGVAEAPAAGVAEGPAAGVAEAPAGVAAEAPEEAKTPAAKAEPGRRRKPRPAARLPMPPAEPKPTPAERRGRDLWLALFVWVGGPLLFLILGLTLIRRRREAASVEAEPVGPEDITPAEVVGDAARLDVLEKRLDEEARARLTLEQRVGYVQEDLKIIRDRINRVLRRVEGGV